MKTQIIRRAILVIIVLFFSTADNGSKVQSENIAASVNVSANNLSQQSSAKDVAKTNATYCCIHSKEDDTIPVVPEAEDHEIHSYNFKHTEKRSACWKNTANKLVAIVYYIVMIISYISLSVLH